MSLYLLLAEDDPSSSATVLLHTGPSIDDLIHSVTDLGGEFHTLVATAGAFTLAGVVDLPDAQSAVALRLVHKSRGRDVQLVPAVTVGDLVDVVERARRITVTSEGDEPSPGAAPPADDDA